MEPSRTKTGGRFAVRLREKFPEAGEDVIEGETKVSEAKKKNGGKPSVGAGCQGERYKSWGVK